MVVSAPQLRGRILVGQIATGFLGLSIACGLPPIQFQDVTGFTAAADTALMAETIRVIRAQSSAELRVDARPLSPDTAVYTAGLERPLSTGASVSQAPFALIDSSRLELRRDVIRKLALMETDATKDELCPALGRPPDVPVDLSRCPPAPGFRSLVLGVPRDVPLPGQTANSERRVKVRASIRSLGPLGGTTAVADYLLLKRNRGAEWNLVEIEPVVFID